MTSLRPLRRDQRLESLFEAIPLAIATFDSDLRLVSANGQYRDLVRGDGTGSSTGDTGTSIYDAFPNALADVTDQIDSAVRGAVAGPTAIRFQHRAGKRLVEATFAPMPDEAGRRGLLFAGKDVTD